MPSFICFLNYIVYFLKISSYCIVCFLLFEGVCFFLLQFLRRSSNYLAVSLTSQPVWGLLSFCFRGTNSWTLGEIFQSAMLFLEHEAPCVLLGTHLLAQRSSWGLRWRMLENLALSGMAVTLLPSLTFVTILSQVSNPPGRERALMLTLNYWHNIMQLVFLLLWIHLMITGLLKTMCV